MGSFFVQEFGDALRQFGAVPYSPAARMARDGGHPTLLCFGPDRQAVAVAFAPPGATPDAVRFRIEGTAEQLNALNSPRLPRDFRVGVTAAGSWWVAARYVPGPSLPEAVERFGPLRREGVRHLAQGLIELFDALHRSGLAGRGLEPGDVVLGRTGPVLTDPGFARVEGAGGRIEAGGDFESWSWSVADDVRAIGAVLYFAVTGRPAFHGCGDILSPAVGDCPHALREAIEASQRGRPQARPSLAQLAAAADESRLPAALAAHWLDEPWQSPDVLRDINDRAKAVAALREEFIDRSIIAENAPPISLATVRRRWHDRQAGRG